MAGIEAWTGGVSAPAVSRGARPRVAIVLAHGYTGFLPALPSLYWARFAPLRACLEALSAVVVATRQPAAGSVERRSASLGEAVARTQVDRVILVGHSMGGLDARLVAARMDHGRRISHVVTMGTPHRGTSAAQAVLRLRTLDARLNRWVDGGALHALTPERAQLFNASCPDRPDVRYISIFGACTAEDFHPAWRRKAVFLDGRDGPHDGLVPARSAAWGGTRIPVRADHLELIGHAPLPGGLPPRGWPRQFVPLRRLFRTAVEEASASA